MCGGAVLRPKRWGMFGPCMFWFTRKDALATVLGETLAVHSKFLLMLVARDLAVLLPGLVDQSAVDDCVVVGEGAEATVAECTEGPRDRVAKVDRKTGRRTWQYSAACRKTFAGRLQALHRSLLQHLDKKLLALVVPQGWTLDLTENACCELRRWDHARTHRKRSQAGRSERQQQRLQEVGATWRELGFTSPPALAAHLAEGAGASEEQQVP